MRSLPGSTTPEREIARVAALPLVSGVTVTTWLFRPAFNNGNVILQSLAKAFESTRRPNSAPFCRWYQGDSLPTPDQFGMMIGQGVAHSLGLNSGDHVTLLINSTGGAIHLGC